MNIQTLYYICYVILVMYILDSDQEPSYNLSKNLLLLPRILKLIEDMVDDSTPLLYLLLPKTQFTNSLPWLMRIESMNSTTSRKCLNVISFGIELKAIYSEIIYNIFDRIPSFSHRRSPPEIVCRSTILRRIHL